MAKKFFDVIFGNVANKLKVMVYIAFCGAELLLLARCIFMFMFEDAIIAVECLIIFSLVIWAIASVLLFLIKAISNRFNKETNRKVKKIAIVEIEEESDVCPFCSSKNVMHSNDGKHRCMDCNMEWNKSNN